ncbi:MAG: serine/threonine-protein kinase RsbW [Roseivirga sp.]|jgi:serine/threonine-protein kinase RsbW
MAYSFNIPYSKNKLRLMRKFVADVLRNHHVSEIETNMMVLAVDEVCANIIIHGQPINLDDYVKINITVVTQGVTFEIIDQGAAFDILKYSEPVLGDLIKSQQKGGVGIMLVKKIMDEIEFTTKPNQNILRLFKKVEFKK